MLQLIEGLLYLHNKKILLGDFKPSNFIFDEFCNIKFTDFLFAQGSSRDSRDSQTFFPALEYLAPELLKSKQMNFSFESEVFSFGCLIFHLLTGSTPFKGSTQEQLLDSMNKEEELVFENGTPQLIDLIQRCMKKEPS